MSEPRIAIDTSKMSAGKREALEITESAREDISKKSFAAPMFMGRLPWEQIHPFPAQSDADKATGDAFLTKLERFLREDVDADKIDAEGEIPDEVVDGLRALGAFGVKIPTKYGGLGLSQTNYTRFGVLVGSHCSNMMALLSAHQSIGIPTPLMLFGTDEQKERFLPDCAKGVLTAFALTEESAGSDPARMTTTAIPTDDGEAFILNGEKLWCTNGTIAKRMVVMAKTPKDPAAGRKRDLITAFIVPADDPGVTVLQRCEFMGLRALYNGVIKFENVRVPRSDVIAGEGRGLKVALSTLNTGRLMLPASCIGMSKQCLAIVRRWAGERVQWGAPIGRHAAVAEKVARITATIFAMEAMTFLTSRLVDLKDRDIRLEAGMAKMWCTERAWEIVNDTVQVKGGRGYETAASLAERGSAADPIERFVRDTRITTLFEGSSEIIRLFVSREAMDPHLKAAGDAMDSRLGAGARLKGAIKAGGFYAGWYPKQFLPTSAGGSDLHPVLRRHVAFAGKTSRKLARRLFHAMAIHGTKVEREQVLLGRFVDVGTELFAISATCSYAQHMLDRGDAPANLTDLVDLFCRGARLRIAASFAGVSKNTDRAGYKVARGVLEDEYRWLEKGVVGAF